ncbi:hypothetical protein K3495_g4034 [Podosphaera aphanis]|nr:hypothetical protein K3495_g4034 [Podosphaera aphanis]
MSSMGLANSKRFTLTDNDSWTNWFSQIKSMGKSYSLEYVLTPKIPGLVPVIYPGLPQYPDPVDEVDYLTRITSTALYDTEEQSPEYEFTTYDKARLNAAKTRYFNERELVKESRVKYDKLHDFIYEMIDDANKTHLQLFILDTEDNPIGMLVEALKTHRMQSVHSVRSALSNKLHELKAKGFPEKRDRQVAVLDEWYNLVHRGKIANHPTYTGYEIVEKLLSTI